jgi:hypothetical protein
VDRTRGAQHSPGRRELRAVREQLWFLVPWLFAAGLVGLALWGFYVLNASGQGAACGPNFIFANDWKGGGQASNGSALTAGVLGASLWLVGGVTYWLLGRRGGRLLLAFAASDIAALVVLWYLSPVIWGPRHC